MNQPKDHVDGSFRFKWNPAFGKTTSENFHAAQCFIDSECIRCMRRYTPKRTGTLINSAKLGTKIGSGHIVYNSPYARYQYYGVVYGPNIPRRDEAGNIIGWFSPPKKHPTNRELHYSTDKNADAQKLWFEKMKSEKGDSILRGALKIARGMK